MQFQEHMLLTKNVTYLQSHVNAVRNNYKNSFNIISKKLRFAKIDTILLKCTQIY